MRHASGALTALAVLAVLGAAVVGGCGGATAAQPASPSPSAPPSAPPVVTADIVGFVRDLWPGAGDGALPALLVAAGPATSGQYDRAAVSITADTTVWTAIGHRGDALDLREGDTVAVWFDGPVAESYPVQGDAGAIQILASH